MKTPLLLLVYGLGCCLALASAPPPADTTPLATLINQLGDDDFTRREQASHRLARREDALPALRTASRHPDAEVRRRSARIARILLGKQAAQRKRAILSLLREGKCDQAADLILLATRQETASELIKPLCDLAASLIQKGKAEKQPLRIHSAISIRPLTQHKFFLAARPTAVVASKPYIRDKNSLTTGLVIATQVRLGNARNSLIVCSGDVECNVIHGSLVIANGSCDIKRVFDSVIISDKSVSIGYNHCGAIFLARSNIACKYDGGDGILMAGGKVAVQKPDTPLSAVAQGATSFLGVRFFELGDIGLQTRDTALGPVVKSVTKGSCFAGKLQPGDSITAVDGKAVSTHEALRKLLRPYFAEQSAFTLTLKRGKQTLKTRIVPKP